MDKEQEILAAALRLFVEFGFHGTPTSKIAKEAGVANGTLFHYFKTKEDLIVALYNRTKESLNSYLAAQLNEQDPLEERMKRVYFASLEWGLENKPQFHFIQQFHFSPHLAKVSDEDKEKQTRLHAGLMRQASLDGVLKSLRPALIGTILGSHVYGTHQYLVNADLSAEQRKEVMEETFVMLWGMITK
ncbi:TetR/AcrR family transcriptional regulator [Dyadobacter sp. CY345]|uniref:TetR/AcrR family transcriptional regulator n=1 Tax=Dyadobacter sp. CY345 TaxID=2909335 RepID=UPI001F1DD656|nr:TetR/AcrR family transcriptional regulator [Dyadobacter sp. CY345]MCF2445030.1 TetR/AcrR family transcriptional regulator [Dyadobacter sp. CY345]